MKRQAQTAQPLFAKVSNSGQQFIPGWPIMNVTKSNHEDKSLHSHSSGHRLMPFRAVGALYKHPTTSEGTAAMTSQHVSPMTARILETIEELTNRQLETALEAFEVAT
jgi:hypothetical protein